jgi:hypothetical protein
LGEEDEHPDPEGNLPKEHLYHATGAEGEEDGEIADHRHVAEHIPLQPHRLTEPGEIAVVGGKGDPEARILHEPGEAVAGEIVDEEHGDPDGKHGLHGGEDRPRALLRPEGRGANEDEDGDREHEQPEEDRQQARVFDRRDHATTHAGKSGSIVTIGEEAGCVRGANADPFGDCGPS